MKLTLKAATVLTWFNLLFWGLIIGILLLGSLSAMNLPSMLIGVLLSAIPLNCYAGLKLHQSIRNPATPLSQQTPMGIRFVGFVALFYGVNMIGEGFALIRDTREILDFMKDYNAKEMPDVAQMSWIKSISVADVRAGGVVILLLGLFMMVNVILNLRLLRWYLFLRKSDLS